MKRGKKTILKMILKCEIVRMNWKVIDITTAKKETISFKNSRIPILKYIKLGDLHVENK